MKQTGVLMAWTAAVLMGVPAAQGMQAAGGMGYLAPGDGISVSGDAGQGDAPDVRLYADGTKAVHEGKWADAVKIFDQVAQAGGPHAAGALYWKAYALSKQGDMGKVLETCAALRQQYGTNAWVEDCGALEIEVKASKGQPVQPQPGQSDELKLLALATLIQKDARGNTQIQKDPQGARAQIEQIVQSDSSESLKEGALFLLGENFPESTYPQVVRISHMDGDVRIARASTNEKSKKEEWETAEMNLPLASGDSLVTGADGRAEIEFENASTIYLAPNSVLAFDDLRTTSQVPHSEIDLLSGTVTLHLDSLVPGETFVVRTPTNSLLTRYPQRAEMRVSSFVDGMALAALTTGTLKVPGNGIEQLMPGKAVFFNKEHAIAPLETGRVGEFAEFDAWVADRHAARTEAMKEEMKESGLTAPVPGIGDMKGQGRFYPCEPYGTCWEPNGGSGNSILAQGPTTPPAPKSSTSSATNSRNATNPDEFFPCLPGAMSNWYPRNVVLARTQPGQRNSALADPWAWTVCHSGWWIHRNSRYVWVAGHKMHHQPPVRWFKFGKTAVFVPLHPKDVKGQAPLNREHGFAPTKEKGGGFLINPVKFDGTHPLEPMKAAPHEFSGLPSPVLAHAEAPHMEMHAAKEMMTARAGTTPGGGVPLHFNHQTGGFTAPHTVTMGGRSTTVMASVGHSGGSYGGGGSHGGGGGSSGGGGGGGHSGGGSSGGGSVSSSSSISVSSSGTGSASSSGGGHH